MSDLVTEAVDKLRLAAEASREHYGQPLMVCYSGGKDSDALARLCEIGRIDCEFSHSLTTADAPQTVVHVRETFARLEGEGFPCRIVLPYYKGERTTMWKLIPQKKMPPTRIARYCCAVLKETSGKGRMVALGVRADESRARSERGEFEVIARDKRKRGRWDAEAAREHIESARVLPEVLDCNLVTAMKRHGQVAVNPILGWTEADVWGFLRDTGAETCALYGMGYSRVGCVMCPAAGKGRAREAADFPSYKRAYLRAFGRMLDVRRQAGLRCEWASAEEVMHWWLEDGVLPGQTEIDFDGLENE